MIGKIKGLLLLKQPPQLLLDVQGIGYEVEVPMSTFYDLPELGQMVALYTHFVVREDAQLLFGFASVAERDVFRLLLKVSGIGGRIALSILSALSVPQLAQAIAQEDCMLLAKVPGIGKKTAERLIIDLRGKLNVTLDLLSPASASAPTALEDVLHALLSLGYSEKEASAAVKLLPVDCSVNEGIRLALKSFSKVR
jgi:Holliday junction DNA helicase RuvA